MRLFIETQTVYLQHQDNIYKFIPLLRKRSIRHENPFHYQGIFTGHHCLYHEFLQRLEQGIRPQIWMPCQWKKCRGGTRADRRKSTQGTQV
jgi:hypothetical protein